MARSTRAEVGPRGKGNVIVTQWVEGIYDRGGKDATRWQLGSDKARRITQVLAGREAQPISSETMGEILSIVEERA